MAYIALSELKNHLRIEHSDEDGYLTSLIGVAKTAIENELDRKIELYEDESGNLPAPLKHAIMILCGDLYNNRESVAFAAPHEVPRTLGYLLAPYKNYDAGCSTDIEETTTEGE